MTAPPRKAWPPPLVLAMSTRSADMMGALRGARAALLAAPPGGASREPENALLEALKIVIVLPGLDPTTWLGEGAYSAATARRTRIEQALCRGDKAGAQIRSFLAVDQVVDARWLAPGAAGQAQTICPGANHQPTPLCAIRTIMQYHRVSSAALISFHASQPAGAAGAARCCWPQAPTAGPRAPGPPSTPHPHARTGTCPRASTPQEC